LDDLLAAIIRAAVDDPVFNTWIILLQDRKHGLLKVISLIIGRSDDGDQGFEGMLEL
jgi:hypothetical protein